MIGMDRMSYSYAGSRHAPASVARAVIALVAAVALLSGGASAAQAATITMAISADPAEEQSMPITVSGVSDMQSTVSGYIRPAGGAPCGTSYLGEIEAGGQDAIVNHSVGSGPTASCRTSPFRTPATTGFAPTSAQAKYRRR